MKHSMKLGSGGMGGFLNPPLHPEHSFRMRGHKDDTCTLSYVVANPEGFTPETVQIAKGALDAWKKPALDSPEVQAWILQVLGYFRGCYKGQTWKADDLDIDSKIDPMLNIERHAGIHLIREYYPEFVPTPEHFKNAHWGDKER